MSLRKRCNCPTSPRCEHEWLYDFRVNGRRYRCSTETSDKQLAKKIEATERTRVLEGIHNIRSIPDVTFRAFVKVYERDWMIPHFKPQTVTRTRAILALLDKTFGPVILRDITSHRIAQWQRVRVGERWSAHGQTSRTKPVSKSTANREYDVLRAVLNKAVEWKKLHENPCAGVKKFTVTTRRKLVLSDDETARLLAACPTRGKLRPVLQFALLTGARIGEILGLTWADIDEAHEEIIFRDTKSDEDRTIPLSPCLVAVLAPLPRRSAWVFSNPLTHKAYTVNGLRHSYRRACVRAGITTKATLHTLRHTMISRLLTAGKNPYQVMALTGHRSLRMQARYAHPQRQELFDALETGAALVTAPPTEPVGTLWSQRAMVG